MPPLLRESRILLSEADVSTDFPWPLHGRLDQLFLYERLDTGLLVDTKSRKAHRIYFSDVIQLSVYKVIIERRALHYLGRKLIIHPTGYVRFPGVISADDVYVGTPLLSAAQVVQLARRHEQLRTHGLSAQPNRCNIEIICTSCPERNDCLGKS